MTLNLRFRTPLLRAARLRLSGAAVLVAAASMWVPSASAQSLPPEVATASSLSSDQTRRVQEFASAGLAGLKGDEAAARERARDELMAPLDTPGVSLAFRLAYASYLTSELGRIATSADDHAAFNALRVAGKLGTAQGMDILRDALSDKRSPVRAGAARSIRETIRAAMSASQSPLGQSKLEDVVARLAATLANESDPIVAKGIVLALDAPRAGASTGAQGALHAMAMEKLSESLATRLKTLAPDAEATGWTEAALAGVDSVRRTFLDPQRFEFTRQAGLKKQAATLSGQSLVLAKSRVSAGMRSDDADASMIGSVTNAAEITLLLVEGGQRTQTLGAALTASLESGNGGAFASAVDEWIARLGKPPFGLDPAQFRRK